MNGPRKPFPLRLPHSIKGQAEKCADLEGTSLNQFISMAVAEKLIRIESQEAPHSAEAGENERVP
jgi:hypothetical protein